MYTRRREIERRSEGRGWVRCGGVEWGGVGWRVAEMEAEGRGDGDGEGGGRSERKKKVLTCTRGPPRFTT